jgi:hypothetical protein
MGKDKSWKLEKVAGTRDDQLKTPEHDEICLWVGKKENLIKILDSCNINPNRLNTQHFYPKGCTFLDNSYFHDYCKLNKEWNEECLLRKTHITRILSGEISKEWKKEISKCPFLNKLKEEYNNFLDELDKNYFKILTLEWEEPIKRNSFVIGIPDFSFSLKKYSLGSFQSSEEFFGFIEVKPKIKSVGETMRQMKIYKSYSRNSILILVTKTPDYKEVFESQGIKYFVWEDKQKTLDKF